MHAQYAPVRALGNVLVVAATLAGAQNAVPTVALDAGRSMVQLVATTSHGTVTLVGIAVAEGGLVVTTDRGAVLIRAGNSWQSVGPATDFLVAGR